MLSSLLLGLILSVGYHHSGSVRVPLYDNNDTVIAADPVPVIVYVSDCKQKTAILYSDPKMVIPQANPIISKGIWDYYLQEKESEALIYSKGFATIVSECKAPKVTKKGIIP